MCCGWYEYSLFVIFDPIWTHSSPQKGTSMEFFKQNFIFNQLERQKLYYYQLSDIKTHESKNLENNQFLLFLTQLGQAFGPHFLNM